MGTARDTVIEQLGNLAPADVYVSPFARLTEQPDRLTVMVQVDQIVPHPAARNARTYTFELVLLGTLRVTDDALVGGVDDELDDLLERVLAAVDKGTTDLVWTSAKRGTYEGTASPCYLITTELHGTYSPESEVTP